MSKPDTAVLRLTKCEQVEIECDDSDIEWAMQQVPAIAGWRIRNSGPKQASCALFSADPKRFTLVAWREAPTKEH
jgi:hypothetical protein